MDNQHQKNILVVGASSGIGNALAKDLHSKNINVFSASRSKPQGIDISHFPLDVTQMQGNELEHLPNELHGVAYCPGTIKLKPFQRLKREDFLHDFEVNLLGAVQVIQQVLPRLKRAGQSSIVLYSTVAVSTGMGFHASVASAKGAIEGLGRSLAAELAPSNIRVNVIAPSITQTPLAGNLLSTEEKVQASALRHPLKKVGSAEEMAAISSFLLSDDSSWITGQVIGVDGGMSKVR